MALSATGQLYQREATLANARLQQEYDRYLADLARQYGIAESDLNANLEGRGIYRSGEAATARTRLSAENQALRSAARSNLEYGRNMNEINLLKQLASMQAGGGGGSGSGSTGNVASKYLPTGQTLTFRNDPAYNPDPTRRYTSTEDRRVSNFVLR